MTSKTFDENKKSVLNVFCDELVKRNKNKKNAIYEKLIKNKQSIQFKHWVTNK